VRLVHHGGPLTREDLMTLLAVDLDDVR